MSVSHNPQMTALGALQTDPVAVALTQMEVQKSRTTGLVRSKAGCGGVVMPGVMFTSWPWMLWSHQSVPCCVCVCVGGEFEFACLAVQPLWEWEKPTERKILSMAR